MTTSEHFKQTVAFHVWRVEQMANVIEDLPASMLDQAIEGSFGTLRSLLWHLANAEGVWQERLEGVGALITSAPEGLTLPDLAENWRARARHWQTYIGKLKEADFQRAVAYRNSAGTPYTNTVEEILTHVFDHATYHVGQLATALRALGITPPSTNYIFYRRALAVKA